MKPSNFNSYPWDSAMQNSECETIAFNIMKILIRTGNKFRILTWDEYKTERLKDGNFSESEHSYFDKVNVFCNSEENAISFSDSWGKK